MSHCLNTELSTDSTNGWKYDRSGKWLLIQSERDFTLSISNTERRKLFNATYVQREKRNKNVNNYNTT